MLFLWTLGTLALAQDCPGRTSAAEVGQTLERAIEDFGDLDLESYGERIDNATVKLRCIGEPVPTRLAAAYHRAVGLRAFTARDEVEAGNRFAAARRVQPGFRFPETLVPPSSPIADLYEQVDIAKLQRRAFPASDLGTFWIDGERTDVRVEPLPAIVQLVDANTTVIETLLLGSGQGLPSNEPEPPEVIQIPVPVPVPVPIEKRRDRTPAVVTLFGLGAAFAGAGGAVYTEAYFARKKVYTEVYGGTETEAGFDKRRSQINARSWVPLTLGGIAGALGVTGIVVAL